MNDCAVSSQQEIPVLKYGGTFTKLLSSLLRSVWIQYDSKIIRPLSGEPSIYIPIRWPTAVSVLNNVSLSEMQK